MDNLKDHYTEYSRNILMYGDDRKLFREIKTLDEVTQLQSDIIIFSSWCDKWQLKIKTNKYTILTISLKKRPLQSSYHLNTTLLANVSSHKDLDILIDSKLTFEDNVTYVY